MSIQWVNDGKWFHTGLYWAKDGIPGEWGVQLQSKEEAGFNLAVCLLIPFISLSDLTSSLIPLLGDGWGQIWLSSLDITLKSFQFNSVNIYWVKAKPVALWRIQQKTQNN